MAAGEIHFLHGALGGVWGYFTKTELFNHLSRLGRGVLFVEGKNNTEYLPDVWKASLLAGSLAQGELPQELMDGWIVTYDTNWRRAKFWENQTCMSR